MKNLVILCVTIILATFIGNVSPCFYPRDWKELPLTDRITKANSVVLGYVETLYPSKETTPIYHNNDTVTLMPVYYTAKVLLQCAFHGHYVKTIQPAFNVSTVNVGLACRPTEVKKQKSYIFMLNGSLSSTELQPMEINSQSAVAELTEPSMEVIRAEFGFDIIKEKDKLTCRPSATSEKKLKRKDPAKVIGKDNPNDKSSANTITHTGLLSLVGALLFSALF